MSEYIVIKKCKQSTAWYSDKIGCIFKVFKDEEGDDIFDHVYTIKISNKKRKCNYGMVDHDDAEVITPSLIKKILIFFGFKK